MNDEPPVASDGAEIPGISTDRCESDAFDVTVADYRRALEVAVADGRPEEPPILQWLIASALERWRGYAGLIAFVTLSVGLVRGARTGSLMAGLQWGAGALLLAIPACILLAAIIALVGIARYRLTWRYLPQAYAQWKRRGRRRVQWNETVLIVSGSEGFGSYAWRDLHGWIAIDGGVILYLDQYDPLPIPNAALGEGRGEALITRLMAAEVPQGWRYRTDEQRVLARAFR